MAWAGSDRKSRLPANWAKGVVPHVLRTHHGLCHVCGDPGADAVDHVVPGDDHAPENLRPIHHHVPPYCHRYKSSAEGNAAQAALRAARTRPAEPHPLDQ